MIDRDRLSVAKLLWRDDDKRWCRHERAGASEGGGRRRHGDCLVGRNRIVGLGAEGNRHHRVAGPRDVVEVQVALDLGIPAGALRLRRVDAGDERGRLGVVATDRRVPGIVAQGDDQCLAAGDDELIDRTVRQRASEVGKDRIRNDRLRIIVKHVLARLSIDDKIRQLVTGGFIDKIGDIRRWGSPSNRSRPGQRFSTDGSLRGDPGSVGTQQPPLGQRGDPVNRGQQHAGVLPAVLGGALAAPVVDVAEPLQPAVALPAVGDDSRARFDVIGDEQVQRGSRCVGERCHSTPAEPCRLPDLHRDAGQDLLAPGPAAAQPRLLTADVGLIHLHHPRQPVPPRAHQHRPQSMQDRPCGLVGAHLQRPLQAQRRDPVLAGGKQPAGAEPHCQRRSRPV